MKIQLLGLVALALLLGCGTVNEYNPTLPWSNEYNPLVVPHGCSTALANSVLLRVEHDFSISLRPYPGSEESWLKIASPKVGKNYGFTIADEGFKMEIIDKGITKEEAIAKYVKKDGKLKNMLLRRKDDHKLIVFNIDKL